MVGLIIAGAMASSVGWRNFWWLNVAINTFVFFAVLVSFPETKWHRPYTTGTNANVKAPGYSGQDSTLGTRHDLQDSGSAMVARGSAGNPKVTRTINAVAEIEIAR